MLHSFIQVRKTPGVGGVRRIFQGKITSLIIKFSAVEALSGVVCQLVYMTTVATDE